MEKGGGRGQRDKRLLWADTNVLQLTLIVLGYRSFFEGAKALWPSTSTATLALERQGSRYSKLLDDRRSMY